MTESRHWVDEAGSSHLHVSLRGMEINIPPGVEPPSPGSIAVYEAKPLPPVPLRRSMASSFSSEVTRALKTPNRSVDSQQTDYDWEKEGVDITAILDRKIARSRVVPRLDVHNIPSTPPDDILSPQPKQSIQKILRLTSQKSPITSLTSGSPSLHNSSQKIRQLTGLDVGVSETHYTVSPISPSSSVYSQDYLEATLSEPDLDVYTDDPSYFYPKHEADPPQRYSQQWPTSVPINLRYSDPVVSPTNAALEDHRLQGLRKSLSPRKAKGRHLDLYHETATALAREGRSHNRNIFWAAGYTPVTEEEPLHFSAPSRRKSSFSSRAQDLKGHVPAPLQIRKAAKGNFGTGNHPQKTPYPTKSTFEDDHEKRTSALSLSRVFKRHSSDVNSIFSDRGESSRSRRVDGLTTPSPPASVLQRTNNGIQGLVAQAKKTTGMMSRTERRRESLKNKIRVITDLGTPSGPTNKDRSTWT